MMGKGRNHAPFKTSEKIGGRGLKQKRKGLLNEEVLTTWLFLLPALLVVIVAVLIPLCNSFILSFQKVRINVPDFEPQFVGFQNYARMLEDPVFKRSVQNTVVFALVSVPIELVLGMVIAMMLSGDGKGARIMRSVMLIPMIMAPVAAGTMWRMMLDKNTGIINYLVSLAGIPAVDWLGNPIMAMVSIIMVDVWRMTPWFALLLISGIKSISGDTIEAALVDGASKWQCFWHVILPQLYRVLVLVLMMRTIDAFKVFDIVFVMTGGGPGMATEMLPNYIYAQGLRYFDAGYAAALALVFIAAMALLSGAFILVRNRRKQDE